MKADQFADNLERYMKEAIRKSVKDQIDLLNRLKARMVTRIFTKGLAASGQPIDVYSTKPMLVGSTSFSKLGGQVKSSAAINRIFATKAKRSKQNWVTLPNKKKLVKLEGGYEEFRKLVGRGRNGAKVNLDLTGDLRNSIVIAAKSGVMVIGIRDAKNANKKLYLHKKYGNVFAVTAEERKWFDQQLSHAIQRNFQIAVQNAA